MIETVRSYWTVTLAALALAVTGWFGCERATPSKGVARPVEAIRDTRCLEPRPLSGVYAAIDDSMRVAVVDGCVATAWPSRTHGGIHDVDDVPVTLLAPHLWGWRATDATDEVMLVSDNHHIAVAGDGLVLSVAPDGALAVFHRFSGGRQGVTITEKHVLRLRERIDDGELVSLLTTGDVVVEIAAITRLVGEPLDARGCSAVRAWIDRALTEPGKITIAVAVLLAHTGDRCLVAQTRRALADPRVSVSASMVFSKIATLEEKVEALLAVVDAPVHDGSYQVAEQLSRYLHPDHCGPHDRSRCLSTARGAELEAALRARIDRDPTTTPVPLHALGAYTGRERHAIFSFDLAATAPCHAIEHLVSDGSRLPTDQVAGAFTRILSRRECARGREVSARVLAYLVTNNTATPSAWDVLGSYLDGISPAKRKGFLGADCYPATRDRHRAADAVLARVGRTRCEPE